jgi:hypothetical protein
VATPHVHTRVAVLYPEACAGGQRASGQYWARLHKPSVLPAEALVLFGFCSGGFSSTAGYVPGNEAQDPEDLSDCASLRSIISKGCDPFLSGALKTSPCGLLSSKPFGFSAWCEWTQRFRPSPPSNDASPLRSPLLALVTMPVSVATGWWLYTRADIQVKEKIL